MIEILKELFVDWKLQTWAEILEIISAIVAITSLIISLYIKSDVTKLKTSYIFDKRIKDHLKELTQMASNLSIFLNDYDNNRDLIKTEIGRCQSELEDLKWKIGFRQNLKIRRLIIFIKGRKVKTFSKRILGQSEIYIFLMKPINRIYITTIDDIWIIYNQLHEVIRQVDNFKKNKNKSLKP